MKTHLRFLMVSLFVTLLIALPVHAQVAMTSVRPQIESLSTLPETDLILFFNTSLIINDAMPRLLPEKELKEMRNGMDGLKSIAGIDLRNLEFVVVAMRFNKPTSDTTFPIPDAMLVARGDFDAKILIGMAISMSGVKVSEEKLGEHTLYRVPVLDNSKSTNSNPLQASFSDVSLTNLDANTIAIGTTNFIKAALEAADGRGRIKAETLASALRDPTALISATGSPVMAFAKSFGLKMVDNPDPNCMTRFGDYHMAVAMGNDAFRISGALNADNPNTARMMKNLFMGMLQEGKSLVPDKSLQSIFDQVKITAEGDEVLADMIIPQDMAAKFIREMLAPKPPSKATPTDAKTGTRPRSKSGRSRRRT